MKNIGVVGAGGWGTALANLMASKGLPITLWGYEAPHVEELRATRENKLFLPGVRLQDSVTPVSEMEAVADCDLLLVVPPSKGIKGVAERLAEVNPRGVLVSCTKGIAQGSGLRMSEILSQAMPNNPVAVLSGPSHAEEVSMGMPAAVVLGCEDGALATKLQHAITGNTFRIYTSTDVAGIELGGALKNIFAIAAGVVDGLGFGDNTKAALVTRALAELTRLGVAMGGRRETFQGLSGIGDLMVTCFSRHSRNRAVGERLGRGETLEQIAASMQMVAEGVPTALSAYQCARKFGIETPITDATHALLYEGKSSREVLVELLSRDPKPEAE
ncbi:MAG: NAD(P)H-dependent glycerol-3-phosphate dehydrogenase [Verrucomicrobiota bacterium]